MSQAVRGTVRHCHDDSRRWPHATTKNGEGNRMAIEFYDVKLREKVQIPESEVKKTKYEQTSKEGKVNVRYAFKAENKGTKLTKFASKADWDALDAPEV
jgi:hypothetical protein